MRTYFFSLFSTDLDDLSVKQLKEILMLNRVDFKGCCEKTELLERVKRLWNELHSVPGKQINNPTMTLYVPNNSSVIFVLVKYLLNQSSI